MKIAVVIPCYNSARTINACLDSVFKQSHKIDEIIVVDDCSIDNTLTILQSCKENYGQEYDFKIIRLDVNSGPSTARNTGIKAAHSEWIAFLDADDYWHESKLQKQIELYKTHPDSKLIGCAYQKKKLADRLQFKQISFEDLCLKNYFDTPTVLVKKEVVEKFLFNPQQKHSEDYRLWLQIVKENKAVYLNEILAYSVDGKFAYGESGLSANIWEMEKGELSNFKYLYDSRQLSFGLYCFYSAFSFLKFLRRKLISYKRKMT